MADEQPGSERTEQPTTRRRDEAQREGRFPASRELPGALVLLGGLGVHAFAGAHSVESAFTHFARGLSALPVGELTLDDALARCLGAGLAVVRIAWPFLLVPAVIAAAAGLVQTRLTLPLGLIAPKWNRIDPAQGFRRLLGTRGAVEVLRAILKLTIVGAVAFFTLRGEWETLTSGTHDAGGAAALGGILWTLWLRIGLAFLGLAAADYAWQWWQHEKSLRMTKQEVKQESREQDGNPQLRSRLRAIHRQMASRRMMAEVRKADVVVRNPTHFAVALRYDAARMRAPRVVGKGERLMAQRIIDEAYRFGVPVVENPPLARALFKAAAIGREVPRDLYRAVAEILAYVYALPGRKR
ncbi:MAG TPA: EscU/YscU/HrcU family type III secretion system export apparatus switch protein [Terriglobales bacterium]|nr:EscU/YscU/HrcU family type III secretion system export apparatus switch protein [Terriglobales bacterium]